MSDPADDPVYDTVAGFVARLADLGVTDAVISPGSRSTPLALCFHAHRNFRCWVQLDERSAGFFALGLGRAIGGPAVLVCTSGTAAANYLPAVIEAHHAGVPLVACTADRPPELRGWGEPQTIDQVGLYGPATRWEIDLPVSDRSTVAMAPQWAEAAVAGATGTDPGPVHLNWPFREPLEPSATVPDGSGRSESRLSPTGTGATGTGATGTGAEVRAGAAPDGSDGAAELTEIVNAHDRGVVVVGPWPAGGLDSERAWARAAVDLAAEAGWPVIGEPISHVRGHNRREACVVSTADHLLSDDAFGTEMGPTVAVLAGRTPTTKPVRLWLERTRPDHVMLIDPENRWRRASFRLTGHVRAAPDELDLGPGPVPTPGRRRWLAAWKHLDARARLALACQIDDGPLLSARVARTVVSSLPTGSVLMTSSSMAVRDLDAFVTSTGAVTCVGNRGASGIDGIPSTALGLAAADPTRPVALYTGDLALLHDLAGLTAAARLGLHLTVVCVDNNGGEIFSLLPIAAHLESTDFSTLFRTPHGVTFTDLDGFGGIRACRVESATALSSVIETTTSARVRGVDLIVVPIDPDADVAQRRALTGAVQAVTRAATSLNRLDTAVPGSGSVP